LCILCGSMTDTVFYCENCEEGDWNEERGLYGVKSSQANSETKKTNRGNRRLLPDAADPEIIKKTKSGKWKEVEKLLVAKADATATQADGFSALDIAVALGHRDVVKVLVSMAPSTLIFKENPDRCNPFALACLGGNAEIVQLLLNAGGDRLLHTCDGVGATCLLHACIGEKIDIVRILLKRGGTELLLKRTKQGTSCLRYCIMHDHIQVIPTLLQHEDGTALLNDPHCMLIAYRMRRLDILRLLAASGAGEELFRRMVLENLDIRILLADETPEIIHYILAAATKFPKTERAHARRVFAHALLAACECGHLAAVRALARSDPTLLIAARSEGLSPLCIACREGHAEAARALLSVAAEADLAAALIDARDARGGTCLHAACEKGQLAAVRALLESGGRAALLRAVDARGRSCLHAACGNRHAGVAAALIDAGGPELLMAGAADGGTCLDEACAAGCAVTVQLLLRRGGAPLLGRATADGGTCLMRAALAGHTAVVQVLCEAGGPALARRRLAAAEGGHSALELAVRRGHGPAAAVIRAVSAS
jgi:ankyrin repeat protein